MESDEWIIIREIFVCCEINYWASAEYVEIILERIAIDIYLAIDYSLVEQQVVTS